MDRILIGQKLEALRHCITRIVEKCPANAGLLAEDADLQDIVVLNLTRSVQLCVDIASHLIAASAESGRRQPWVRPDNTGTYGRHRTRRAATCAEPLGFATPPSIWRRCGG